VNLRDAWEVGSLVDRGCLRCLAFAAHGQAGDLGARACCPILAASYERIRPRPSAARTATPKNRP
jgi:hypothetical protein